MRFLNIKPMHDQAFNCQEDLIYSVARWWQRDFEMMFAEAWGFQYTAFDPLQPEILAKRIGHNNFHSNWSPYLKHYHGIQSTWHDNDNPAFVIEIAKSELMKERPIAITIDTYWCPWNQDFYQKFHGGQGGYSHTCLIVGVDDKNNLFIVDPFYTNSVETLSYHHFAEGYSGKYMLLSLTEEHPPSKRDMYHILQHAVDRVYKEENGWNHFDAIRQLANEFEPSFDYISESKGFEEKPGLSPIIFNLKTIGMGRIKFSYLLKFFIKIFRQQDLIPFVDAFNKLGEKWYKVSHYAMRVFYTKRPESTLERMRKQVLEIADEEEKVAEQLQLILGK